MSTDHRSRCDAPICQEDKNENYKNEVVWMPGEPVCQQRPHSKAQQKQIDINKCVVKGKFKNLDIAYTAHDLETKCI